MEAGARVFRMRLERRMASRARKPSGRSRASKRATNIRVPWAFVERPVVGAHPSAQSIAHGIGGATRLVAKNQPVTVLEW